MYSCSKIHRYQNVINQGGHPIALVSMVTTLCEKSLYKWNGDRVERGESRKPSEPATGEMIFPDPVSPPKSPQMGKGQFFSPLPQKIPILFHSGNKRQFKLCSKRVSKYQNQLIEAEKLFKKSHIFAWFHCRSFKTKARMRHVKNPGEIRSSHAFCWASDLAKSYQDWGPDLCESRGRAHSPISASFECPYQHPPWFPCRLECLRLKFTKEPSIFVDGDLTKSIKRSASDRLGDLVP